MSYVLKIRKLMIFKGILTVVNIARQVMKRWVIDSVIHKSILLLNMVLRNCFIAMGHIFKISNFKNSFQIINQVNSLEDSSKNESQANYGQQKWRHTSCKKQASNKRNKERYTCVYKQVFQLFFIYGEPHFHGFPLINLNYILYISLFMGNVNKFGAYLNKKENYYD